MLTLQIRKTFFIGLFHRTIASEDDQQQPLEWAFSRHAFGRLILYITLTILRFPSETAVNILYASLASERNVQNHPHDIRKEWCWTK